MSKIYRNLGLAVGALAVLAAVGPGLAASIAVPEAGDSPAAGQGAATVQGFEVTDIDWIVNDVDAKVTKVSFTISRSANGAATVSANADGNQGNAVVRVRLEEDEDTFAAWQGCAVTNGAAVCELDADAGAQMDASELGKVNIIAFDRR
jgi:hypothetical protein